MKEKESSSLSVLTLAALPLFSACAKPAPPAGEIPLVVYTAWLESNLSNPKLVMVNIPWLAVGN